MIEDNITDITTAPAEQPVPIIDEQTQQVDVAVTPDAPPPVEPEKPAVVLKDINFFNNNVDWHNSNLAEGEKPLKKYKFAQDIPDEEYNGLKGKVEVGTLNEYNTLSTKYPEYKVGKAEKYEDINDENYTKLHNANKAQTELTRYNEIVRQLQNKRGLPKIKDRKDLTPELLGKAESAAVEDLNADMAKRSKKLGVEFKPFESFKAIDWDSVGNTYKLSSVKEANESLSKLKEVYGDISPEIKKLPEFSSYEDFEKRKGDLVSLEKSASAAKSKAEQNKFLENVNNQVALVNKELDANIPIYTDFQTAVSAFKPAKDGTIPFNKKVEEIQTTKGLEDFRNQISSIQPTGGARGDITAPNLATDNSPFNLEQKRKEYLAKYNERANNIAMLSKKTLKTGDNAPIFTDEDVALTSPYIKMAPMRPSPSVDANWLNREGKFGLGAPNIKMDEVSGRPIDPRVDELSELVSKTNKRSNELSVTLKSKVAEYNDYAKEIEGIQKSGVAITPNQKLHLDNLKEDVDNLRLGLDAMSSSAVSKYNNLFSIKKTQGSTAGDILRIAAGLPTELLKVIIQSMSTAAPYFTKDFSQKESADVNKWLDKRASSLIQAISQSSPEHLQSAGTFMKGLDFSASMVPYILGGEVELGAKVTASEVLMLMSSFQSELEQLNNNAKTENLSQNEKNGIALSHAVVSTAAMTLGLKAGIKGKGNLGMSIENMTYNVFKNMPTTMSGVRTILSSALAGGSSFAGLNFASSIAGEGVNKAVNLVKGEEIFPAKNAYQIVGHALESAGEGLFNGAFFGGITGIVAAVNQGVLNSSVFNAVDEMYNNPAAFNVAHNEIRRKLALGEITPKEAATQFKSITVFKDIMSQIPEDLNKADRYAVTKLLLENKKYEAQMSGLNESFAAQFKKRIENNNKEIEKIAASHIERTLSEKEAPTTEEGKPTAEATPVEPTEEQKAARGRVDDFVEELATSNPDAHERAKEDPAPVIDELIESSKEKLDAAEPEEKAPIQEEIDRLEGIKKDVELGNEKPVEEQEAKPLGEVSDSEHTEFIDTGKVDPKRLEDIANKVKNNEPLSDREKDIFTNKTAEVNNLIREQAEPKAEKSDPGGAKFTPELEAQMPQHKPMFSALKKGLAAIKSIMPNIDVRIHDTHESMQKVLDAYEVNGKDGKRRRAENVKGNYGVFKDGSIRIDFNLAAGANRITAAHEIGHIILEKAFGDNPKMFDYLKRQVSSLVGETKNQYLLNFIKMYGESKKSNEYLTELAAIMGGGKIEPTVMRKVAAAINKIINKASLGRFSPFEDIKNSNELVSYFSSLSEALHAGKEIKLNEKYTPKEEPVSEEAANEKPKSTQQLKDEERVLMSAKSILSRQNEMIPPEGKKQNNSNIAKMLQEKAMEFWGGEIVTSDTITEEQERIIKDNIKEEVKLALKKEGNAGDWYTKEIELALEIISVMHPEIKDRTEALKIKAFANEPIPEDAASFAARLPLAVTSQNLDVEVNSKYGEEQYDTFKKTGKFDPSREYGSKAESISGNLELANVFIDNVGLSGLMDFCKKEFKVSDLEKEVSKLINKKVTISGYRNDVVYGSAIFGPKIGQGFLQNLMGNYYPVTIDLWLRRTWGRITGDVVGDGVTKGRLDRLVIETKKSKNFIGVEIPEIVKKYNSKNIESLLDGNEELRSEYLDFARKVKAKGDIMYKSIHDQPMTKLMYEDFLSGKKSYEQIASELSKYRSKAKEKYNEYAKKERLNKRKPLALGKWLSDFYNSKGMSSHPTNKEISKRKPEWHKSAVVIINDLKPIDVPTDRDRQVISRIINDSRIDLEKENIVLTNADIQAIIWFPEKDIWAVLGGEKESTKKLSYGGEFKKIAEERGFGEQAKAAEERVKSRGASRTSSTLEQGPDEKTGGGINEVIPKSKQSLVDDAKMTKDMTEDEKGNYLFYHYSPGKIPNIDPRHFGKNLRTGRDERPGIGVSMYYTRPDRRDVGGSYGYVVRVPKDKVYPFNSDPMNLMDKARATFEKMYPGQAFDKNKQVAFVSQEAAKAGYDMTVAKWGNDLRAQTTKVMKGETYEKPHPDYHTSTVFNPKLEKYVANENKPKSKQSLVETEQRSRFEKSKMFAGVDKSISDAASSYKKKENLSDQTPDFVLSVSENDGKKIADAYEQMAHDPENPKVKQGFTELIGEIKKQAKELLSMGYKFELAKEGDGYNSDSKKMAKDVIENKRILVDPSSKSYGTKRTFDKDNMGLQDSGYKDANGVPMTNVELIRAVHDLFGHAEFGNGFGAAGEENAWRNHMSMFTPLAQKALTTTTRGQNSWVNFGPEMRNPDGSIKKKGDEGYLSPSERPFAEQKIGFLPDWAMENSYGDRVNVEGREVVPTNKHISEGKEVYEIDDIDAFYDAISAAKSSRGLDGIQVELKDKSKYQEILDKGGRFLITKDGKAGMMIEADGNTGSGFAHKDIPEGQNTLKPLLLTAIKLGARYTDAYDTYLPNYYSKFGFKVLNRIPFNKEFADKGWEKTILSQEPDVVTMYWDGGDRSKIEKNYGSFPKYEKNNGKVINDYDKAIEETKNKSNEIEEFASLVPPKIDKTKSETPKSKQQLSDKGEEFKKEMQGFFDRNKDTGKEEDVIENAIANAEKKWAPWIRNNQEEYNSAVMGFKEANGIKIKAAPSQAKISGEKPKKITVNERTALKDQIKLEIKAARDATKNAAGERKAIGDKLNEMVDGGKITTKQAKILTDRFANVNTANPQMVKKFLDYAEKVFEDADYADKKANANSINRRIKKALKSSTHLPDILLSAAKNFASIPTNKVEDLSEHNDIGQKILDAVKSSGIRKLKDGNISDNIREAVKISDVNEYIDKANEYIESLPNDDIPEANEKVDNSEDINNYIKETFDGQKEAIKNMLDTGVSPDGERYDFAEDETRLIKKLLAIDLDKAGNQKSKERILEAMDHLLTNGDIGNIKYIVEDEYQSNVEIDEGTKTLIDLTKKKTLWAPIAAMRARAWNAIGEVKTDYQKTYQQLKYASVRRWDNILKNFGGNEVFDKSLKKLAINYSAYNSRLKQFDTTRIQHKLIEKFNGSKRKLFDFNVRYTMYARQLEHENNPGNKKSLPAFDYIKATYDATGTQSGSMTTESRDRIKKLVQDNYFGDNKNPTAEQIDEFNKKFEDGDIQIDSKRLYDSFDKNEKIAIEKLQAVVKGIGKYFPRVAMMRGVNPTMFAEYHPIRSFGGPEKRNLLASELGTVMMNASTRAGVLEERTGKATPISLDPFSTINNATRDVLIDYYMSKPIKIVKKIMNNFEAATKGTDSHNIASAMNQITTELVDQVIGRSYTRSIITDASGKVTKHVTKFLIGKASRSVADFATNLLYSSIKNTKEIGVGFVKHFNLIASNDLGTILENMGSYSVDRISPHGTMVGQFTDPDTMDIRIKDNAEMVSKSENAAYKLRYNAIHYPARITSWVMEHLSSTPDLAINRPLWLGTADVTFKKLTGKDIDFKKIKDKDPDYFERYGNEIQESASAADKAIADATSTKNPFAAAPKFTLHKMGEFSKMNNYLLSFQQQNFETVTDAVMHLYTGGKVSRVDAVRTIAAAYARAGVYKAVQKAAVTVEAAAAISLASMLGLLNDEDKDEFDKLISSGSDSMGARAELAGKYLQYFNTQDPSVPGISPGVKVDKELMTEDERAKKSWERQRDGNNYREIIATGVKQQMAQDLLNRSFGNMFNGVQNTAIEYMNMARVGEDNYDPYKDNLVRPAYPVGNDEKHVFSTVAGNMLGSYGLPIEAGAYLFEDYHDEMKSIGKSMKSTQEEINKLKSYENLSKEGRDKMLELESKKEKLIAKSYKSYVQLAYRAGLTAGSVTGILPAGGDINTMVKAITKDRIMKPKDWEQIMKNYYKYSNIGGQLQVKSNK